MSHSNVQPTCVYMPGRHHHSAPKYNEDPSTLQHFLSDVQATCVNSGLYLDTDYIKWAIYYAPIGDAELWEELDSRKGTSWADFTAELLKLYPGSGSETERLYSETELEYYVEKNALLPMDSRLRLGEYHGEFLKMYDYLKKHGRISEREAEKVFIRGFDMSFRTRIRGFLQLTNPKHHPHDPFPITTVVEAAAHLLSSSASSFLFAPFDMQAIVPSPAPKPIVSKEDFELKVLEDLTPAITQLVKTVMQQQLAANSPQVQVHEAFASFQPLSAPLSSPPALSGLPQYEVCEFCSDATHLIRECGTLVNYLQHKLCSHDLSNRIVLPNGQPITHYLLGNNLRERVDSWHKMCAPPTPPLAPATSTNMPAVDPPSCVYNWMDPVASEKLTGSLSPAPVQPRAPISSSEVENGVSESDNLESRKNSRDILNEDLGLIEAEDAILLDAQTDSLMASPPLPDPECDLNPPAVLTQNELLALSPDTQHQYNSFTTTEQAVNASSLDTVVGTASVSPYQQMLAAHYTLPTRRGVIVAPSTELLCHLDVTLDDKVHCEGLLANGSEIVAIRRDLWQKLDIPIDPTQFVTLEGANGSKSASVGLLSNLKVSIGPITLYLQAQVLDDVPYDLLLGRPFSRLAQARIQDFLNGDQHVTLIDPNTRVAFTVHSHVSSHPNSDF